MDVVTMAMHGELCGVGAESRHLLVLAFSLPADSQGHVFLICNLGIIRALNTWDCPEVYMH
jgi:hypothetical protein